jgi:hypothetical protein
MTTDDQNESPPFEPETSSPEPSAFIAFLTQPWDESSSTAHAITYVLSALIIGSAVILVLVHG